jgi:hypothetical protein
LLWSNTENLKVVDDENQLILQVLEKKSLESLKNIHKKLNLEK